MRPCRYRSAYVEPKLTPWTRFWPPIASKMFRSIFTSGFDNAPRLSRNGQALYQGLGLAGFAERALIHENQLALVPMEMPFAQAALLGCGVVTGAGAVL